MIFLDSWVFLEYVFTDDRVDAARDVIERANTRGEGGLITPTVIAEVAYRVRTVDDASTANDAVRAIRTLEHVDCLPVVADVGEYAAELRAKYYDPGELEMSYQDAIHLATATLHEDCDVLYTGDDDFDGIEEVETVVL